MLWLKALHVVFMVTWFAALFYLPRLFVYHVAALAEGDAAGSARFKTMERKLFIMMTLGAAVCARRWVATAGPCSQPQQNTCPRLSRNDRCASRQERQWLLLQAN